MVFLLPVEQDFGATRQQTAGVYSTYMLTTGFSAPLAGLILRQFGARVNYALGVLLTGCAMFLAASAAAIFEFYLYVGILASMGISAIGIRSEEHTSELQSLMRISYAVFCLKKKK